MSEIQFPFRGKSDILALIAFSTTMLLSEILKAILRKNVTLVISFIIHVLEFDILIDEH